MRLVCQRSDIDRSEGALSTLSGLRTPIHTQGGAAADEEEEEEEEEGDQRLAIQVNVSVDSGTCNICTAKVRSGEDMNGVVFLQGWTA